MKGSWRRWPTGREACALLGLLLAVSFCLQWQQLPATVSAEGRVLSAEGAETERTKADDPTAWAATIGPLTPHADPLRTMIRTDPAAFFRGALERYERSSHDYVCTFSKQERIEGRLKPEEVMQVRFRQKPFSVDMLWVKGEDRARRAIYVEGKWTGKHGEKLAMVEPAGWLARLLVGHVMRPIDGSDARQAARHPIDHFGFANSMRLILEGSRPSDQHAEYVLRYTGQGEIDGRPTYVVERRPLIADETGVYEDQLLVVHVDQEYLLPTCCTMYADEARTKLTEQYLVTNITFNVGLTDHDFTLSSD